MGHSISPHWDCCTWQKTLLTSDTQQPGSGCAKWILPQSSPQPLDGVSRKEWKARPHSTDEMLCSHDTHTRPVQYPHHACTALVLARTPEGQWLWGCLKVNHKSISGNDRKEWCIAFWQSHPSLPMTQSPRPVLQCTCTSVTMLPEASLRNS